MFTAKDVTVGNGSKYQSAGISEKVKITQVDLNHNEQWKTYSISMKTINENEQEGQSKRLSLNTEVKEGNKTSGWTVSAKYLINILMSTGKTLEEAQSVLEASTPEGLVKNLTTALVGKEFRGLFGKREYQPGKFAIELYTTEPVGGTKLTWDPDNQFYVKKLPTISTEATAKSDDLPF